MRTGSIGPSDFNMRRMISMSEATQLTVRVQPVPSDEGLELSDWDFTKGHTNKSVKSRMEHIAMHQGIIAR